MKPGHRTCDDGDVPVGGHPADGIESRGAARADECHHTLVVVEVGGDGYNDNGKRRVRPVTWGGRAGQGRGQGRAGQGRAGQGRAGQGRAGQGRAGQGRDSGR